MLSHLKSVLIKINTIAVHQTCDFLSTIKSHKSSVLIEITFSIPVCIILLFFIYRLITI